MKTEPTTARFTGHDDARMIIDQARRLRAETLARLIRAALARLTARGGMGLPTRA